MATLARGPDISTQKINLEGRFSYIQDSFAPKSTEKGTKQYQLTLIFDKTQNLDVLKNAAFAVAEESWPGKAKQKINAGIVKTPFLDGDGPQGKLKTGDKAGQQKPELAGKVFIRLTSGEEHPPRMLLSKGGVIIPAVKTDIKSGDYGFVVLNPYAWSSPQQGDGISFGYSMVLKSRSGESLGGAGGGGDPDDYFEAIADEGSAPEAAKTGAGAAGLFG
jgi:hypothetical protein